MTNPNSTDLPALTDDELFTVWDDHYTDVLSYNRPSLDRAFMRAVIEADRARNASAVVPEGEPEPMFYGRWHHGNGNLCCGTMRYFRADFDTNPAPDVREGIFDWVCTTMNAALDRWRDQKRARESDDDDAAPPAASVVEAVREPLGWRSALKFYADRSHFMLSNEDAWDTVSGEPSNFWCDEEGTATVEDGTVAARALAGDPLPDEDEESPVATQVNGLTASESGDD